MRCVVSLQLKIGFGPASEESLLRRPRQQVRRDVVTLPDNGLMANRYRVTRTEQVKMAHPSPDFVCFLPVEVENCRKFLENQRA